MFPEWSVNRERFVIENICRPEPDVLARWLPA